MEFNTIIKKLTWNIYKSMANTKKSSLETTIRFNILIFFLLVISKCLRIKEIRNLLEKNVYGLWKKIKRVIKFEIKIS